MMESKESEPETLDIDNLAHQKGQLKMVVCGHALSGRSSLISSLGNTALVVGHDTTSDPPQPQTCVGYGAKVEVREMNKRSTKAINVLLWDTPGLGRACSQDSIKQIAEKITETDILIYCIDMREELSDDAVEGIAQLTSALGEEIWRNAVFVLTYANALDPPQNRDETVPHFQRTLSHWESSVKLALRNKVSLSEELITDTAIVPIGYQSQSPPDRKDWQTPFWREVFRKMKENNLLDGIDAYNVTIGPPGISWIHVGLGTFAGIALGAVTGGIGLGVVGAVVGGGIGGVGAGSTVAAAEHFSVGKLIGRMRE